MKQIYIFIILIVSSCSFNAIAQTAIAQTAQDFIKSCVKEEQRNGASSVIVSAALCGACKGVYKGFIYSKKEPDIFQVRYIKYFDGHNRIKIFKDTTLIRSSIETIFNIKSKYQDTILWQIANMEQILTDTIYEKGMVLLRSPIMTEGRLKYFAIYEENVYEDRKSTRLNSSHT